MPNNNQQIIVNNENEVKRILSEMFPDSMQTTNDPDVDLYVIPELPEVSTDEKKMCESDIVTLDDVRKLNDKSEFGKDGNDSGIVSNTSTFGTHDQTVSVNDSVDSKVTPDDVKDLSVITEKQDSLNESNLTDEKPSNDDDDNKEELNHSTVDDMMSSTIKSPWKPTTQESDGTILLNESIEEDTALNVTNAEQLDMDLS